MAPFPIDNTINFDKIGSSNQKEDNMFVLRHKTLGNFGYVEAEAYLTENFGNPSANYYRLLPSKTKKTEGYILWTTTNEKLAEKVANSEGTGNSLKSPYNHFPGEWEVVKLTM